MKSTFEIQSGESMKNRVTRIVECIFACTGVLLFGTALQIAVAQDSTNLP
jgi:hypothetical protein